MLSPSFVSGTTVWAATLCSGVEISPFGDARDPRAGDAYPQRLPPRRTPGAPQLRSGLKLSLDPARRFGPVGNMRRAVHPPPGLATAIYRLDAFPSCLPWQDIVLMRSRRGPRTRKTPVRGNISPACIQIQLILARYARHASKKPRKAPLGNAPREHLAAKGRFRRPKPPNHARRTNLAIL